MCVDFYRPYCAIVRPIGIQDITPALQAGEKSAILLWATVYQQKNKGSQNVWTRNQVRRSD